MVRLMFVGVVMCCWVMLYVMLMMYVMMCCVIKLFELWIIVIGMLLEVSKLCVVFWQVVLVVGVVISVWCLVVVNGQSVLSVMVWCVLSFLVVMQVVVFRFCGVMMISVLVDGLELFLGVMFRLSNRCCVVVWLVLCVWLIYIEDGCVEGVGVLIGICFCFFGQWQKFLFVLWFRMLLVKCIVVICDG